MKIWTYISTLLAGIIAGLVIFLKLDSPDTVINDNTRIGKMKQRGEGNNASVTVETHDRASIETRKERREARRSARVERRLERQEKRKADS